MPRYAPTWAETGLTPRGDHASSRQILDDIKLEQRIQEEAGPVITRPIVERLLPGRGHRPGQAHVVLRRSGLYIGAPLRRQLLAGQDAGRCHLEVDNADRVLRIIPSADGPWVLPGVGPGAATKLGGPALVRQLVERGMEAEKTYPATVESGVIVVQFGKWR